MGRVSIDPPPENLQQFMKESSPTFDFNDNNDNRSNNDGLWLPFPSARQRRRRRRGRRRKIYEREERNIPKGRRLINGGGNFSLPPRTSATSLYHGSSSKRDRRIEMTKAVGRRARRRRARQVALNWKRPKLEFSCQSWASWPPGVVSKPIAFWLYLPPPPSFFVGAGFVVGTDKFVDVYTEITRVTSAGERSWEFVGVASEPIDCWKFDHLTDWFDLKLEYETRTLEMTMLNLRESWRSGIGTYKLVFWRFTIWKKVEKLWIGIITSRIEDNTARFIYLFNKIEKFK